MAVQAYRKWSFLFFPPLFTPSKVTGIEEVSAVFDEALVRDKLWGGEKSMRSVVYSWRERILQLKIGGLELLGNVGKPEDAIVLIVGRKDSGFCFVCCNAGRGLSLYHPSNPSFQSKIKYDACVVVEGIPEEKMTSPAILCMMLGLVWNMHFFLRVLFFFCL